ncbi:hypothetical protein A1O1_01246 [Capronia coronata CBS 617.96]|uniref:Uncharacterized protein n=1 Tax=Capronia coronata CBS 617.96 TaxID=1182541 RepID=W9Z2D4_9EURO|nr:uncharacterized protein A1O1_01246 [Capronia coronata CBS 617.96]EXJ96120.1 hypothetical protein A1O1_01246 [Capronia coronata CBS 617.96]
MSAGGPGDAPPNPSQGRHKPGVPRGSGSLGRRLALGGLTLGLVYAVWPKSSPQPGGTPSNAFKTQGVRNVENAYENAGATATGTKAYGGTIQGKKESGAYREGGSTGNPKGYDQEGIGEDQRPSSPTKIGESFNEFKYGSPKGK